MSGFRNKLPAPGALIMFEAVARRLSFTAAARELGVSQAATSRQVRILEDHLGLRLFRRDGRQIRLTEAGEELFQAVAMGLGHIAGAVDALRARRRGNDLTVATSIAFSAFWLMPRLAAFHAAHSELELRLQTSDSQADWLADNVDVAVAYGLGAQPGFEAEPLFGDRIFPVAAPDYFGARSAPRSAEALLAETLLQHDTENPSWITWPGWFVQAGVEAGRSLRGPHFNNYVLMIQAAQDGQGVGLGWQRLVEPLLRAGNLQRVGDVAVAADGGYAVFYPERRRRDPKVEAFRAWIKRQAAEDWS